MTRWGSALYRRTVFVAAPLFEVRGKASLFEPGQILTLRYRMSNRFSLEAQQGPDRSEGWHQLQSREVEIVRVRDAGADGPRFFRRHSPAQRGLSRPSLLPSSEPSEPLRSLFGPSSGPLHRALLIPSPAARRLSASAARRLRPLRESATMTPAAVRCGGG